MGSEAYEKAGVNLEAGNVASNEFFKFSKETWVNREGEFGEPQMFSNGFAGTRGVDMDRLFAIKEQYPDAKFIQYHCSDGTGNKPKVAQRIGKHDTIGEDLVAMVSDDATAVGAEAISLTSILVVNTLGKKTDRPEKLERLSSYIDQLGTGYKNGANKAGIVIENGEIAEHGEGVDGYGEFKYDWQASLGYLALQERLIDGSKVKKGDAIVALQEKGFRCNGFSLVLNALEQIYGYEWHNTPIYFRSTNTESTWGREVLRPSKIYSGIFTALTGGYNPETKPKAEVHSIAHITGGGIPEKLGRKLKGLGIGARLDNLYMPGSAMIKLHILLGLEDQEMYNVLNMGNGALVVTSDPDKVIAESLKRNVEAQIAGEITDKPEIEILSKGRNYDNPILFPIEQ